MSGRRQLGRALARAAVALLCACAVPGGPLPDDRQDPARYVQCDDPAGREAWEQALVHLQAGDDAAALPLLRTVVERCPDHVPAHRYYQDAALHVGGAAAAAMRAYYAALAEKGSPVPDYARARLLESSYARKTAVEALLVEHADFAWGHLALARLQRSGGRLADAVESYQRAIRCWPDMLDAHLELAECLVELGRPGEAVLPYENYLRGAPNDRATVRAFVHLLLYRLGRPADARQWIEQLRRDDPRDVAVLMDLAAADWLSGHLDQALDGYLQVLRERPDQARAALDIGYLHYDAFVRDDASRREHWPKARRAFQLYLLLAQPEEGYDYFEKLFAVPFRLKEIEALLGPGDGRAPSLEDLK